MEKGRKVRVVEKGNLQKGTFLEILTMDDSRRIQFRYKTDKSNLDLSREELSGNQPHRVLAVAQTSETAQSMSCEEVSVAEEDVTPRGTSKEWINIPGSGSHHIYAWPLHIGSSEVNDVFQQQIESSNTISRMKLDVSNAMKPVPRSN